MLSKKRFSIAENVGNAVAYHNFVMMLNPKFRGKNFKWEDLENFSARLVASHIGLTGDFGKDHKEMEK